MKGSWGKKDFYNWLVGQGKDTTGRARREATQRLLQSMPLEIDKIKQGLGRLIKMRGD